MKKLLMLLCATLSAASAQENLAPHVISTRVGETIDAAERAYFKLFPAERAFDHAQASLLNDGRIALKVWQQPTGESASTIIFNRAEMTRLRVYFENFETLADPTQELPFSFIDAKVIARLKPEEVRARAKLRVQHASLLTRSGNSLTGHMLFAADSALLWKEGLAPFDWRAPERDVRPIRPAEIAALKFMHEGKFVKGMGLGFLFGGGLGAILGLASGDDEEGIIAFSAGEKALVLGIVFGVPSALLGGVIGASQGQDQNLNIAGSAQTYSELLPKLKAESYFRVTPAPEILQLLAMQHSSSTPTLSQMQTDTSTLQARAVEVAQTSPPMKSPSRLPKLHFGVSGQFSQLAVDNEMRKAFTASGLGGVESTFFGTISYPSITSDALFWGFHAEYNLSRKLRLAAGWQKLPQQEVHGKDRVREIVAGKTYRFGFEYAPKPALPPLLSRFEPAFGLGLVYQRLELLTELRSSDFNGPIVSFRSDESAVGGYAKAVFDYYMVRNLSLRLGFGFFGASSVPAAEQSQTFMIRDRNGNVVPQTKTLRAHTLHLSGFEIALGLRCHL